jgi:thiamine transport system substrate-binding protein
MNPRACLAVAIALAQMLSGCLGNASECSSTGPTDFAGQELRVLDHGAFRFIRPLFENQTGARLIQLRGDDAGTALQQAIDSKGNPVADVIFGIDNALFFRAARAGILEPYASPRLEHLDLPRQRLDDFRYNGHLLATPVDHGFINVNYDARLAQEHEAEKLPTTLHDLARPEWARQFVTQDPRTSTPGLGFLIATVATFGETGPYTYLDYWRDLLRNGVLITSGWTEAYVVHFSAGYGQWEDGFVGDRTIVTSYTTSPALEAYFGDGTPPSVSLEPPRGVFHQVETVAILRCTQQLPLARTFVDLLLGPEFQGQTSERMAMYPVARNASVIHTFPTLATPPAQLDPAPFTSAQLDAGLARWVEAWANLYREHRA